MPKETITTPGAARSANRAVVLRLLRHNPRLSRVEIARQSGLSAGTVSRIVGDLLREKLLVEDGSRVSTGGRPQTRLSLNHSLLTAVGVEIHVWETRIALAGLGGRIVEDRVLRTPSDPAETLDLIVKTVTELGARFPNRRIEGVGVGIPGVVDTKTGIVRIGFTPEWNAYSLREYLTSRLPYPVFVENNTRAAALAEHDFGGAETLHSRCLLYLVVDEGIGIGVVLDGDVYRGPNMAAGEFGQMIISESAGLTTHEVPGSLEQLASNPETCARFRQLRNGRVSSDSSGKFRETAAQVRLICSSANEGDNVARQALAETCRFLGIGLHNVIWGLNPDIVIVDGAITDAWPLVKDHLLRQFPTGSELVNFRCLTLRPSALRGQAAILGALSLPFRPLFSEGLRLRSR